MKHTRKLKIITVRRSTWHVQPFLIQAHCPVCAREVELLTQTQAAEVLEIGDQMLGALIAAGRVHAVRTISGSLRVCKDSLFAPAS